MRTRYLVTKVTSGSCGLCKDGCNCLIALVGGVHAPQPLRASFHTLHTLRTLRPTLPPHAVHSLVLGLNVIHQHLRYVNHPHAGCDCIAKAACHRQPWHVLIRQPHPKSANGVVPVSVAGDAALRGRGEAVEGVSEEGVSEEVWTALALNQIATP